VSVFSSVQKVRGLGLGLNRRTVFSWLNAMAA